MRKPPQSFTWCIVLLATGCQGSGGGHGDKSGRVDPQGNNRPPTITGSPPPSILAGEPYEFTPTAADPDDDTLVFQIAGKPGWARFEPASGRLWGTPDAADAGNFTNIRISVSDGRASAALGAFGIAVNQVASGSVTLSWHPPNQNGDGSPLSNLAGYRIYYGRDATALNQRIVLRNPGLTRYVVENLAPAKWYFAMTSINASGAESKRSARVSKTVA